MSNSFASQSLPRLDLQTRAHSRFSAWFHGRSVVGNENHCAPKTWLNRNPSASSRTEMAFPHASGLRSPSSTRSIIDPISSPNIGSDTATPRVPNHICEEELMRPDGRISEEGVDIRMATRMRTRLALSRPRRRPQADKTTRECFPRIKSRKLKRKAIGCLISSSLLAVISTICKFEAIGIKLTLIHDRHRTRHIQSCHWRVLSRCPNRAYTSCYYCLLPLPCTILHDRLSAKEA